MSRILKVETPRPASCSIREERTGRLWVNEYLPPMLKQLPLPPGLGAWRQDWASISWVRSSLYTLRVVVRPARAGISSLEGEWLRGEFSASIELEEGAEAKAFAVSGRELKLSWNGESLTAEMRG